MKKIFLLFFFFLVSIKSVNAQVNLSVYAEVSIVTAGPGTVLYEAFGHSAIRIKDPVLNLDLIYNYGMFDFDQPNFYTNFTKGKLLYKLARYDFKYFLASYKKDKRWVKQQILNLNQKQKQAYFAYLENNALPKNATYLYDPYFNNCATKLRDITSTILGSELQFGQEKIDKELSFRQLMDNEIPWNTWGSFGINLALGSKLDAKAAYQEYMYLPDYVYSTFKKSTVLVENKKESLVKKEEILLDYKELDQNISIFNPLLIFSIIALIGLFITYKDFKNKKRSKWLDFLLMFATGIIGVLIVFLWFFTNHSTTPNNFNFLWAFAPNLLVAFFMLQKNQPKWFRYYFNIIARLIISMIAIWAFNIQSFPIAVTPFLILLLVRYLFLEKILKKSFS